MFASGAAAELSVFTHNLKDMAFWAAWGAANERRYGTGRQWEHLWNKASARLDEVKDVIEDENIANQLNRMSVMASWGAANERAYGMRSDSQVDWDMHRSHAAKLKQVLNDDALAGALETASFNAAWWAANSENYGDRNKDVHENKRIFDVSMETVKRSAPTNWPVAAIKELFQDNSFAAAAQRAADLSRKSFMKTSSSQELKDDWRRFDEYAQNLKKYLGPEQSDLYEHLETMATSSAWGAANERTYGRKSTQAQEDWGRFRFHNDAGRALYKGPVNWDDISEMMTGAAWGAANERAYGKDSKDARDAWNRFDAHSGKVLATAAGKEDL